MRIKDINRSINTFGIDKITWLSENQKKFDLVFADPPYDFESYDQLINAVLQNTLVYEGLFILVHRQNISFVDHANFVQDRKYGEVKITFFRNETI